MQVRVEGNLVRALKCGVFQPTDLKDGDVYYKLVGATFIDEEEARGRHIITVDVIDENFNRIQGAARVAWLADASLSRVR